MINYVPWTVLLVQSLNVLLDFVSAQPRMLFGPYNRRTKLYPNGSTAPTPDRFAVLNHAPTITVHSCVDNRAILAPTRSLTKRLDLKISRQAEAFGQLHFRGPMIQKYLMLRLKKAAPTPGISFGPERQCS